MLPHAQTFLTLCSRLTCIDPSPQLNLGLPGQHGGWGVNTQYPVCPEISVERMNEQINRETKGLPWKDGFLHAVTCPPDPFLG